MSGKQKPNINGMTLVELTHMLEDTIRQVQENPEEQIGELQIVLDMLQHGNIMIVQMAILSLTEVFIDIAPLYKIDKHDHDEKIKTMIKKDEKQIISYELKLLKFYGQFTESIFTLVKIFVNGQDKLIVTCFNSLCRLLSTLGHFNYMRQIVQHVIYGLLTPLVAEQCYTCLASILANRQHSMYEAKLMILSFMQKVFLTKAEHQLPDNYIDLLSTINIDTKHLPKDVDKEEREKKRDLKKQKREYFSQKEKDKKKQKANKDKITQQKKLLKEVQKEKEEAQADIDKKSIAKNNGLVLNKIFYFFFKIIKLDKVSKFFDSAINGILKYVHLIDITLIQGLIDVLIHACKSLKTQLKKTNVDKIIQSRLFCIYALQSIINGPGVVFAIDDKETSAQFYQAIRDIIAQKLMMSPQVMSLVIQLIDATFITKRHFSQEVAGSFIKVFCILANLQVDVKSKFILSLAVKLLLQKYSKTQKMLEEDNEGFGLNSYNTKCDDPAATNALNTSIQPDLQQLQKTFAKDPRTLALITRIVKNEPLPSHLQTKNLLSIYNS